MAGAQQKQKMIVENGDFLWAIEEAIKVKLQSEKIHASDATVMVKDLDKLARDVKLEGSFTKSITTVTNQSDKDMQSAVIRVNKVKEGTEKESRQTRTGSASASINPKKAEAKGSAEFKSNCISKEESDNTTTTNSSTVQANHTRSVSIGEEFTVVKCTISAHADLEICVQLDNEYNRKVIMYAAGGMVIGLGLCAIPLLMAGGFLTGSILAIFSSLCGILGPKIAAIGTATATIGTKIAEKGIVYTSIGSGLVTSVAGTIGGAIGYKKVRTITITAEDIFKHLVGYEKDGNKVHAVIDIQHCHERIDETIKPIPPPNMGEPAKEHRTSSVCEKPKRSRCSIL